MKLISFFRKYLFLWILSFVLFGFFSKSLLAIPADMEDEEIFLLKGDLESIKTVDLTRISVANPKIADIANINEEDVLILAKAQGQTAFFLWDKYGKRRVRVHVFEENLDLVKSRAQYLLAKVGIPEASLEINEQEGKVVVSGDIPEDKRDKLEEVIGPFRASILNLTQKKEEKDLIQIDCQIAEINVSATKTLGIDWTNGSALTYTETLPAGNIDKPWDAFRLGEFKRSTAISSILNALITKGEGRVLSRPKLVVKSGEEASFLVGGQIPVTTRTISGDNILENVIYKDYGVDLTVTPRITEEGQIDIDLNIDISDIDASLPVANQVSFTNRTAETTLLLDDGQTVVLAGLIKRNRSENISRIPFFSDVPLFGALFRNKTVSPDKETEVVISLTPTILHQEKKPVKTKSTTSTAYVAAPATGTYYAPPKATSPSVSVVSGKAMTTSSYLSEEMIPYIQDIQHRVAQNVTYPSQAERYGWEGTVKLSLEIANDGTLIYAEVKESSGYDVFDQDALLTVNRLAPYAAFPADSNLQELTITIPIIYSLDTY